MARDQADQRAKFVADAQRKAQNVAATRLQKIHRGRRVRHSLHRLLTPAQRARQKQASAATVLKRFSVVGLCVSVIDSPVLAPYSSYCIVPE